MRIVFTAVITAILFCGLSSRAVADQKPVKVFVLVGQSNMQGHAKISTLSHIGMDPRAMRLQLAIESDNGVPRVFDDIWISSLSTSGVRTGMLTAGFGADENKIGPELTFGIFTQQRLGQPIVIIKTAWGGKSLHTDFRSPSAGPFQFSEQQIQRFNQQNKDVDAIKAEKKKATGHYYRQMIQHVQKVLANLKDVYPDYDAADGYELSGMVWFQGWNDMVDGGIYPDRGKPGGYEAYSKLLAHFIRDVRKDLASPKLPFVIGVMGVGGPVDQYLPSQQRYSAIHQGFRDAMAAPAELPEFKGNVKTVLTEKYWDLELHLLRAKEAKVKQEVNKLKKEGKLDRAAVQVAEEELRAKEFTDRETQILKAGVSNAEYHYLGCAKIMAQIGKAFSDALAVDEN